MKLPFPCSSTCNCTGWLRLMTIWLGSTLCLIATGKDVASPIIIRLSEKTATAYTSILEVSNASQLSDAISNSTGGEVILLASGKYGAMTISNLNMPTEVTIMAALNAIPEFSSIQVTNSSWWRFSGLHVKPRFTSGADTQNAVRLIGSDITFEQGVVNYAEDTSGWSASDWLNRTGNGIVSGGTRIIVRRNQITNVDHAIASDATYSIIAHNTIDGFRGDACRSLGDFVTFEYNSGKNAVAVDDNHDDFFQCWSVGTGGVGTGEVVGVVLRGNRFISYENENMPFATIPQGIGLFDGIYRDWVIENNVIITGHWHGISLFGGVNCRIVHNTVIDRNSEDTPKPWIQIVNDKDGVSSQNCIIRNNLSTDINFGTGVTADNNQVVTDPDLFYVNPAMYDLHLLDSSPAVDVATEDLAATIDRDGIERPQGNGIDVGAYELLVPISDTDGDNLPDEWEMSRIGNLDQGALDDKDGDRHTNLLEFVLGSDPSVADSEDFVNAYTERLGTHRLLTISYRRSLIQKHRKLVLEFSSDLVTWTPDPEDGSLTEATGTPVDNGDNTERVELLFRTPLSSQDKLFARLMVK